MWVTHDAQGEYYEIAHPEGTRLVRCPDQHADGQPIGSDHRIVSLKGEHLPIPSQPPELLSLLAETGNFGISLVGGPVPEERLAGVSCPGCGETDLTWLQREDASEVVHCDRCGVDFGLPVLRTSPIEVGNRSAG